MNEDINIDALLEFSQQQDDLIEGQMQQVKQVLTNNRHLRTALKHEHSRIELLNIENQGLQTQIADKDNRIAELEAQVNKLMSRPTNVAGNFIAEQKIGNYYALRPAKNNRRKLLPESTNQLLLWTDNPLSM